MNGRGLDADGLLGADILLAFDLDIDVPDGKLTLYRSRLCPNVQPPWHEPWIEITGVRARKDRLLLPFELDGVQGEALLDTGAQGNVLSVNMARRMGLTEQVLASDPAVRNSAAPAASPSPTCTGSNSFGSVRWWKNRRPWSSCLRISVSATR